MTFLQENPSVPMILGGLTLVWLLALTVKLFSLARGLKRVNEAARKGDLAALINTFAGDISTFSKRLAELEEAQAKTALQLDGAIQRVGLVRFDAFGDIGGGLSFALALLNESGDGLVVSTINGRSDSRSYAKVVRAAQSAHPLSREEEAAIGRAMGIRTTKGETAGGGAQDEEV